MEPLYAADAFNPEQGWVLQMVYDGNTDTSEVWVSDSNHLNSEPICWLGLPEIVPIGFHGTWNALKRNE